jgi:hypothetical protein
MVNEHVFMNLVLLDKNTQPSLILRLGKIIVRSMCHDHYHSIVHNNFFDKVYPKSSFHTLLDLYNPLIYCADATSSL